MFNISNIDYTTSYDSAATIGEKVFESRDQKYMEVICLRQLHLKDSSLSAKILEKFCQQDYFY